MSDGVICTGCGKIHTITNVELGFGLPDAIDALCAEDRERRCRYSGDAGVLDEQRFFIRGVIPLVVSGRTKPYNLGVWAEVSRQAFTRIYERWSDPDQASEPRFPGALANALPLLPNTLGLDLHVQLCGPTTRPDFLLAATEHPLYIEQLKGVDEHRVIEYSDCGATRSPSNYRIERTRDASSAK
jgi:hypothetical protein